jgi:molybdopterin converting factor small subunit
MNRADANAPAMIEVRVRLFADLRRFLPKGADGPLTYRLPAGATVEGLLSVLGVSTEQEITAGLNGSLAQRGTRLSDGDEIDLFSPMEGG